jgi:hypothetical protein
MKVDNFILTDFQKDQAVVLYKLLVIREDYRKKADAARCKFDAAKLQEYTTEIKKLDANINTILFGIGGTYAK